MIGWLILAGLCLASAILGVVVAEVTLRIIVRRERRRPR